jgi:hypothetical protein
MPSSPAAQTTAIKMLDLKTAPRSSSDEIIRDKFMEMFPSSAVRESSNRLTITVYVLLSELEACPKKTRALPVASTTVQQTRARELSTVWEAVT